MSLLSDAPIMTRQDIINQYQLCLKQGVLTSGEIENFLNGRQCNDLIIQQSSGSSLLPINIPRTTTDINDIANRVLNPYIKHYGSAPARIALLGGISHSEGAIKLQLKHSTIQYFTLNDYQLLEEFQPQLVSCYPSVMRELISHPNLRLSAMKAFKLGGETLFPADINKIFSRWPSLLIIEQYGSTETPAVAIRPITSSSLDNIYQLQTDRFSFLLANRDGWQPIIVKDQFCDLAFNIGHYFNTGDEGYFKNAKLYDIRRRHHIEFPFREGINQLLASGIVNLQIFTQRQIIHYQGAQQPPTVQLNNQPFALYQKNLFRILPSNKLPLVIEG